MEKFRIELWCRFAFSVCVLCSCNGGQQSAIPFDPTSLSEAISRDFHSIDLGQTIEALAHVVTVKPYEASGNTFGVKRVQSSLMQDICRFQTKAIESIDDYGNRFSRSKTYAIFSSAPDQSSIEFSLYVTDGLSAIRFKEDTLEKCYLLNSPASFYQGVTSQILEPTEEERQKGETDDKRKTYQQVFIDPKKVSEADKTLPGYLEETLGIDRPNPYAEGVSSSLSCSIPCLSCYNGSYFNSKYQFADSDFSPLIPRVLEVLSSDQGKVAYDGTGYLGALDPESRFYGSFVTRWEVEENAGRPQFQMEFGMDRTQIACLWSISNPSFPSGYATASILVPNTPELYSSFVQTQLMAL